MLEVEKLGGVVSGRGAEVAVFVFGLASSQMTPFLSGIPGLAEAEVLGEGAAAGAGDVASFQMMPFLSGAEPPAEGGLLDGAVLAGADVPADCGLLQMIVP